MWAPKKVRSITRRKTKKDQEIRRILFGYLCRQTFPNVTISKQKEKRTPTNAFVEITSCDIVMLRPSGQREKIERTQYSLFP